MAQGNGGGSNLVKLDDFEGELEEHWQDARELKLLDKSGHEIGTVEDVYILEDSSAVHLLKVSVEGRHLLIPADALLNVTDEGVEVEQDKNTIMESPEYDSEDVPDPETSRAVYAYYGYPDQLTWGSG
jgi:sporulation protein YlmC with PRC-barrel domain